MEPGTILALPRPCPECGNLMIWGELHTQVEEHVGRYGFPRTSAAYHFVTRSDMPPTLGYPVVAAVCPVCGHISLYAAGVVPPARASELICGHAAVVRNPGAKNRDATFAATTGAGALLIFPQGGGSSTEFIH
jgi:hypothetical protein